MKIEELEIKGCFKITTKRIDDIRGFLQKIIEEKTFENFDFTIKEVFFARNKKNVIRGMHFQKPPFEVSKIAGCISGEILDVLLDINPNSETFGESLGIKLSEENSIFLFIPKGIAHGYKVLSETSNVLYLQSDFFNASEDASIHYNSFGFNWGIENPILSKKDEKAESFEDYQKNT
jgi:dTDP-4-dehydrorhamnose 3,5-epimerase/CDP-3, 6-dideoxy-D-glycero-D-glycero-4-hexulose-5-epimerase